MHAISPILRNLSSGAYVSILGLAGNIALIPVLLVFWGAEPYGHWLILYTIPSYFILAELGLSTAVANAVAILWAQGRQSEAELVYASAWTFQGILWGVVFVVGGVVAYVIPLQKILGLTALSPWVFLATAAMLSINALASLQVGLVQSIYRAAGKFDTYQWLTGHFRGMELLASAIVVFSGGGFVAMAAALLIVRFLHVLVLVRGARRALPEFRFDRPASWSRFRALLPQGIGYMAYPVGQAILNQGTIVAAGQQVGAVMVVGITVGRQVARLVQIVITILFRAVEPEITLAYAKKDYDKVLKIQVLALASTTWLCGLHMLLLFIYGPSIVKMWLGNTVELSGAVLLLFGLETFVACWAGSAALVPYCSSQHARISVAYLLASILGVTVCWLLLSSYGIATVPFVLATSMLGYGLIAVSESARILKVSRRRILSSSLRPIALVEAVMRLRSRTA